MAQIARAYNGLNGVEVKTMIQAEIKSDVIERLQAHWNTHLRVEFEYLMRLESYPSERPLTVSLKGQRIGSGAEVAKQVLAAIKDAYDRNTDFGLNIAFPKVTWTQTLALKAWSTADAPPPVRQPDPVPAGEVDLRVARTAHASTMEPTKVDPAAVTFGGAEMSESDRRIAALEMEIARLRGAANAPVKEMIGAGTTPARTGPIGDGVLKATGTGLLIEGGARGIPADRPVEDMVASTGRGSHVGVLQPRETLVDEVVVSRGHPSLQDGGMGHPDAARRAAGMQVPTPARVVTGGVPQIVDFPLGEL